MEKTFLQRIRERAVPPTDYERRLKIVEMSVAMGLLPSIIERGVNKESRDAGSRINGNYNHLPVNLAKQRARLRQFQ